MIKLSIIIPIYNTEITKLQRCLESIKYIKSSLYECILVDDGSRKDVSVYLNKYAKNIPEFRYIRKENGGVSSARNLGIEHANGKYLCFVDSDDAIEPKLYDLFLATEYNTDLIFSDLILLDRKKSARWSVCNTHEISYKKIIQIVLTNGKINGPCCKFIKKDFLCRYEIKFHEEMVTAEDLVFFLDMLLKKPSMAYIKEVSYYYYKEQTTGFNRLKKYPSKHYYNYREAYFKEIICISNGNFNKKEIDRLKKRSLEKYIMSIFNTTLEMIEVKIPMQSIEQDLKVVLDQVNLKNTNIKTKARGKLMLKKRWCILKIISAIRRKYLTVKGLV